MFRSSPPEVFSKKNAAQIRSKPTGEQPRNFIEITATHRCAPENPKYTRRTPLRRRTTLGDCSCMSKEF